MDGADGAVTGGSRNDVGDINRAAIGRASMDPRGESERGAPKVSSPRGDIGVGERMGGVEKGCNSGSIKYSFILCSSPTYLFSQ